jgi:hypothetical protein
MRCLADDVDVVAGEQACQPVPKQGVVVDQQQARTLHSLRQNS